MKSTHDGRTSTVRQQLKNIRELGAAKYKKSGARLSNAWVIANDKRG